MQTNIGTQRKGVVLVVVTLLAVSVLLGVCCLRNCDLWKVKNRGYEIDDYGKITGTSIFLRTDRVIYDEGDWNRMVGMLVNLSPHPIEIRSYEPLAYKLSESGWWPPVGAYETLNIYPPAYEEGSVAPDSVLPIYMGFALSKTSTAVPGWMILEQPYFYNEEEYVVYSNEFAFSETDQPARFRAPPDFTEVPSVYAEVVRPDRILLVNNTDDDLWFNPICSDLDVEDYLRYPSYPTLQRHSGEGTWQVFRPDEALCTTVSEPLKIAPGEQSQIALEEGYSVLDELEPGLYRWHLVYYKGNFPDCYAMRPGCLVIGVHLFTSTFEQ